MIITPDFTDWLARQLAGAPDLDAQNAYLIGVLKSLAAHNRTGWTRPEVALAEIREALELFDTHAKYPSRAAAA